LMTLWGSYKNLFKNEPVGFFDIHYFFPKCKDGFDVVIANPPYISIRTKTFDNTLKKYYKENYTLAIGQYDLFVLFIEKSDAILNNNGILSFIIPKKLLTNENFTQAREFLLNRLPIVSYVDAQMPFESAGVEANVIVSTRQKVDFVNTFIFNCRNIEQKYLVDTKLINLMPFKIFPFAISPKNVVIINSIQKKVKQKLGDFLYVMRGMECGFNHPSISKNKTDFSIIRGENISKYSLTPSSWFVKPDFTDKKVFKDKDIYLKTPKLVTKFVSNSIDFAIDYDGVFNTNVVYNVHLKNRDKKNDLIYLKYFLAITNSELINFWFFNTYVNDDMLFPHIQKNQLSSIPIIIPKDIKPFVKFVDQILTTKKANPQADTSALEQEIDQLVYELYGLTDDEIAIVEDSVNN